MRILFAGTPEIALPSLQAIHTASRSPGGERLDLVAVLTSPDAPAGRKRVLTAPPVKTWAVDRNVPVLQPARLDASARQTVAGFRPDILVAVAYGKIFGPRFLDLFDLGGLNVHPSLLPRHRGPSPIPAAILAGDNTTGVTVQRLAREMDAGDILLQRGIPLSDDATTPRLERELGLLGAELLVTALCRVADGVASEQPQNGNDVTYCSLIRKADGTVTWTESARRLDRMIRAYTPWPGVRCAWHGTPLQLVQARWVPPSEIAGIPALAGTSGSDRRPGEVIGVDNREGILVQTVDGILAIRRLKLQARKEMDFQSFLNGNSSFIGSVLEQA